MRTAQKEGKKNDISNDDSFLWPSYQSNSGSILTAAVPVLPYYILWSEKTQYSAHSTSLLSLLLIKGTDDPKSGQGEKNQHYGLPELDTTRRASIIQNWSLKNVVSNWKGEILEMHLSSFSGLTIIYLSK